MFPRIASDIVRLMNEWIVADSWAKTTDDDRLTSNGSIEHFSIFSCDIK